MAWRLLVTRAEKIQSAKAVLTTRLTRALCRQPRAGSACLYCKETPATANTTPPAGSWLAKAQLWGATCDTCTLTDEQFLPSPLTVLHGALCQHWSSKTLQTPALKWNKRALKSFGHSKIKERIWPVTGREEERPRQYQILRSPLQELPEEEHSDHSSKRVTPWAAEESLGQRDPGTNSFQCQPGNRYSPKQSCHSKAGFGVTKKGISSALRQGQTHPYGVTIQLACSAKPPTRGTL